LRNSVLPWLVVTALAASSSAARAQVVYQGPGTYVSSGNQTYGPKRTQTQSTYGSQTYVRGTRGHGRVYSTYDNRTYGPNGGVTVTQGNMTYESNGTVSQSLGHQTYTRQPNGKILVCSTYTNQTYCH
jgi:hypothetical protein